MKKSRIGVLLFIVFILFSTVLFTNALLDASYYIASYDGDISNLGGTVTISYQITGTDDMDKIGATTVILEECASGSSTWRPVKYYYSSAYTNMLIRNAGFHSYTLTYPGNSTSTYRATITLYAEKDGGSDSRTIEVPRN